MGFARAQPAACLANNPAAAAARLSARLAARPALTETRYLRHVRLAARPATGPLLAYALPRASPGRSEESCSKSFWD